MSPRVQIPALLDRSGPDGKEFTVFESGAILMYLAEKVPETSLYPREPAARSKVVQWLMWQMGTAPYLGQFGHFFKYAPEEVPYAKNRYTMEAKRILDVLDKQLGRAAYVTGGDYTVADIAIFPWIRCLDKFYGGGETLGLAGYANVARWLEEISARPAVVLGLQINGFSGDYMNHSSAGSSGK
jgi:GSH-dependent disulfide-bond oxidoreductase